VIEHFTLSARRLDGIIQDLSDLLAVRKRHEERQRVELAEVVENARLSVSAQLERSGAQLRVDLAAAPVVYSVKTYVQSILLNLLSNALKYRAPERPPVITLTARRRDGYVVVSVADNGLGIDLARHGSRVFGLYKRFHAHTEGKGLGLYLVKTQAEALGGKVEVESTPGEGSTFRVYLPGAAPERKSDL
jgi:signal transduction histidine kinase